MANFGFHFVSVIFKCGLGTLALVSSFQKWSWKLKSNHIYPNYGLLKFKNLVFLSTFFQGKQGFQVKFSYSNRLKTNISHPKITWLPQNTAPTTIEYCWGCLRVILGPFKANLSPFGGLIASYWNHFGADFSPLSGQKWPKYPQIMYSCTGHKYTTVGDAFVGHIGIIWAIWGLLGGPIARF